jgi:hypothetical protein
VTSKPDRPVLVDTATLMLAAVLSAGCACVERLKAQELSAELRSRSIERSGPTMQAAAARLGATLLPERVQVWHRPWQCSSQRFAEEVVCDVWWGLAVSPVTRVEDPAGKWHQVIPVADDGRGAYLRVARRGDTLFVLVPDIKRRAVRSSVACECDGGPTVVGTTYAAMVLDDFPVSKVVRVSVPVTEDYIAWTCEAILVQAEPARRSVASAAGTAVCE